MGGGGNIVGGDFAGVVHAQRVVVHQVHGGQVRACVDAVLGGYGLGFLDKLRRASSSSASRVALLKKTMLDTSKGITPTAWLRERRHSSVMASRMGPTSHSVATVAAECATHGAD